MTFTQRIESKLIGGAADEILSNIYSCGAGELGRQKTRFAELAARFEEIAPDIDSAQFLSAPGRTEIGGNHTDHQMGCVVAAAVTCDTLALAAKNNSNVVKISSQGYEPFEVLLDDLRPRMAEDMSCALVRGIADSISRLGYDINDCGFTACITSDVPGGSGLSSSAAFEVLIGTIWNELFFGGRMSALEIAKIGQRAENLYAHKPSGLLDQATSSFGGLVSMDFSRQDDPVVKRLDVDFSKYGYELCVVNTGGSHADLTEDYAAIPQEMKLAAQCFEKEHLRAVDREEFYRNIDLVIRKVGERPALRAMHFFDENERAAEQADALEAGDMNRFLELVDESGRSSENALQNIYSSKNNERRVSFALEYAKHLIGSKGVCRVHGGGFAGTIQAYVPIEKYKEFEQSMDKVFGKGSCLKLSIRPCGAIIIDI